MPTAEFLKSLQAMNPGWTTDYAPMAMMHWLRSLGVIDRTAQSTLVLTTKGREWAERIHWIPEALPAKSSGTTFTMDDFLVDAQPGDTDTSIVLPALKDIVARVQGAGRFETSTIALLHASLWSHQRRHFAMYCSGWERFISSRTAV